MAPSYLRSPKDGQGERRETEDEFDALRSATTATEEG